MLTHPEKFTKVTGTIRQMEPDLPTDPDDKPGTIGITADVWFTPLVGTGDLFHLPKLPSPTDPEVFAPELRAPKPIPAKLVDGVLKDATGNSYIQLWAADMFTVPSELRYEVSFKNVQAGGKQIPNITSFAFVAVPDATIDLSAVARVPNSPGPMARGEQGIGIENITELEGVLTFDMNDGSTYDISLPGFTSALTETRAARDAALAAQGVAEGAAGDAVTSASQAEAARGTAVTAKDDAVTAKNAAESARGTAVTAKDDAVTAKNAAESARGTAVTAKDDAVTAKNAAESARGTAVTAKDDAVTAKNAAESARGTAVTAKDNAVTAKNAAETAQAAAEQALADANAMIIPTASVTKPKLSTDLQASIDKADSAIQAAGLATALTAKQSTSEKGQPNGYAPLDAGGKLAAAYQPSYVDDVLEYANLAAFPATGENGKIYTSLANNRIYRWSGSVYVEIAASPGSTDVVPEGATNKYYTDARAQSALAATVALLAPKANPIFTGTAKGVPYPIALIAALGTRAVGYLETPGGLTLPDPCLISKIVYSFDTADASGSTTVELRKNGVTIAGTSVAITAANQLGGGAAMTARTISGLSIALAEGDVLNVYVSAIGTTPGKGVTANIKAVTN
ncbi:minor tail protein [Rhodococcus phage Trogglehumper]|uniref:Minor tail protein n=1 Tax=Rhodococcus phage Trogglehumper TaxID=3038381 RepID=A0AAF0GPC4_9CAUD|nr:minor tail protein [Rhodococcus phage Trogglehumper]